MLRLQEAKREEQVTESYKHYCNCGGYAPSMNGRDPEDPHMIWCAQRAEFMQRKQEEEKNKHG